jgi:processive 1,2-diacylglycerol beta-glucosyltransferase
MNLLILHASAGAGHKRAAEALAAAAQAAGGHRVTVRDILDFTPPLFRRSYAKGYLDIVKSVPELWGYMYARSDRRALLPHRKQIRTVFNKLNTRKFLEFYDELAPDATICTHFMPLEILATRARQEGVGRAPFCVVTDFAVHALWIVEGVARYYVATEEARRQLLRKGQPPERVQLAGIPVDPIFGRSEPSEAARRRLGLRPDLPLLLLLSGGCGVGPACELVRSLRELTAPCQLLVVAGNNAELKQEAEEAAAALPFPCKVFGFVNNMHELMDAAEIVISKPGGLTSSEVLAKGKPLVVIDPIPGQEQRNCEHLLEAGAAVRLFEIEDAPCKIGALLADPARRSRMAASARALGRPQAAAEIVADVLNAAATQAAMRTPDRSR